MKISSYRFYYYFFPPRIHVIPNCGNCPKSSHNFSSVFHEEILLLLLLLLFHYLPQRKAIAPHVNPAPKPTNTTKSLSFILPLSTLSDKAIGMEADELFPYFLIVLAILSS